MVLCACGMHAAINWLVGLKVVTLDQSIVPGGLQMEQ